MSRRLLGDGAPVIEQGPGERVRGVELHEKECPCQRVIRRRVLQPGAFWARDIEPRPPLQHPPQRGGVRYRVFRDRVVRVSEEEHVYRVRVGAPELRPGPRGVAEKPGVGRRVRKLQHAELLKNHRLPPTSRAGTRCARAASTSVPGRTPRRRAASVRDTHRVRAAVLANKVICPVSSERTNPPLFGPQRANARGLSFSCKSRGARRPLSPCAWGW